MQSTQNGKRCTICRTPLTGKQATFCKPSCKQKATRRSSIELLKKNKLLVGQLTQQLETAMTTIAQLKQELQTVQGTGGASGAEKPGPLATTVQSLLRNKHREHGGDDHAACAAIASALMELIKMVACALSTMDIAKVPRHLTSLKLQLAECSAEEGMAQAPEAPDSLRDSASFLRAKASVATPAQTVLLMRRTLHGMLHPAIDRFVAAAKSIGFAAVEDSVAPIKACFVSASPLKADEAFVFDIYASLFAFLIELVIKHGPRAIEHAAIPLNMAYRLDWAASWDDEGQFRDPAAHQKATRGNAKAILLEAASTPRMDTCSSSVRRVTSVRQATKTTFKEAMGRVEPEVGANTVVVIATTTQKEGYMTQFAAPHPGEDCEETMHDGHVTYVGNYLGNEDGRLYGADAATPDFVAGCALVPIVRALHIGAPLNFLHVGCFSERAFLDPLCKLIVATRKSGNPPADVRKALPEVGAEQLCALLSDDALHQIHVVYTTAALPGDTVIEVVSNYARYAGCGSLDTFWIRLQDKLQQTAGYYTRYGYEDAAVSEDVHDMLMKTSLAERLSGMAP